VALAPSIAPVSVTSPPPSRRFLRGFTIEAIFSAMTRSDFALSILSSSLPLGGLLLLLRPARS